MSGPADSFLESGFLTSLQRPRGYGTFSESPLKNTRLSSNGPVLQVRAIAVAKMFHGSPDYDYNSGQDPAFPWRRWLRQDTREQLGAGTWVQYTAVDALTGIPDAGGGSGQVEYSGGGTISRYVVNAPNEIWLTGPSGTFVDNTVAGTKTTEDRTGRDLNSLETGVYHRDRNSNAGYSTTINAVNQALVASQFTQVPWGSTFTTPVLASSSFNEVYYPSHTFIPSSFPGIDGSLRELHDAVSSPVAVSSWVRQSESMLNAYKCQVRGQGMFKILTSRIRADLTVDDVQEIVPVFELRPNQIYTIELPPIDIPEWESPYPYTNAPTFIGRNAYIVDANDFGPISLNGLMDWTAGLAQSATPF